jgi:TPR repeat protein
MDMDKINSLYELASKGNVEAQYSIGCFYQEGIFMKYDINKAIFWLEKSANQNHRGAQYQLAHCYISYYKKNIKQAIYWYKKAAIQENYFCDQDGLCHIYAREELYYIYNCNNNLDLKIKKDINQALYWLRNFTIEYKKRKRHGIKSYVLFP